MIQYLANLDRIEKVLVDKVTKTGVWIDGKRKNRESEHYSYCDCFVDAQRFLLFKYRQKIRNLKTMIDIVFNMKDDH